jgi:hypothetical protein
MARIHQIMKNMKEESYASGALFPVMSLTDVSPVAGVAPTFNVQGYGAVGDGVTDDTIAIQAAFTAAVTAGGVVYFPPGTYLTSAQINIYGANIIMRGAGPSAIIKAKDNANINSMFWIQSTADNFTAESFLLDGNRDNLGTSGSYGACIGLNATDNMGLTFRDLEVKNVNSIGICLQSASPFHDYQAVFERCWIHHNGMLTAKEGNDVFLYNARGCKFTDCLFEHGYGTGEPGVYAGGGVVGSYTETTFVNCTFRDNFNGGGQTGGQGHPDIDNRWSYIGCVFELTEADPHATCGIEGSDRGLLVDSCHFYNHDSATGIAIAFHGDGGTPTNESGWLIVTNCVFDNNTHGIEQTDTGDAGHILIANNRFENGTTGIVLGQTAGSPTTNVIIANNDLTNNVTTPLTLTNVTDLVKIGNLPATIGDVIPGAFQVNGLLTGTSSAVVSGNVTITKAGGEGITLRSGAAGSVADFSLGRTASEAHVAIAGGADDWSLGSAAGDTVIRTETKKLLLNTNGGGAAAVTISTANDVTLGNDLILVGDTIRESTQKTPASAAATGTKGDICHDTSFIYICTATDTWKRVAIATW